MFNLITPESSEAGQSGGIINSSDQWPRAESTEPINNGPQLRDSDPNQTGSFSQV